ncbi:alpha/beta fold hydrolase [Streptomyces sp. NPDC002073]
MTTFVLVSGGFTGGWAWREVAARLRRDGAEVYPVTLTGMGDRRHLAGPDTDLDTHVDDVVQVIDHIDHADGREVVLVGHCYGIFPVLGAADRRPERISRVVYVDAPMPRDGDSVLSTLPDPAVSAMVRERAAQSPDGRSVPAPTAGEREIWGNVTGVPEEGLARMVRLAAPQPLGTYASPLRLTGAAAALPSTGVFCTAAGFGIGMAQAALDSGDPRFRVLADPAVSFFELGTGHWPMFSAPEELADVLVRAAAGEGVRLTPTA